MYCSTTVTDTPRGTLSTPLLSVRPWVRLTLRVVTTCGAEADTDAQGTEGEGSGGMKCDVRYAENAVRVAQDLMIGLGLISSR